MDAKWQTADVTVPTIFQNVVECRVLFLPPVPSFLFDGKQQGKSIKTVALCYLTVVSEKVLADSPAAKFFSHIFGVWYLVIVLCL